MNSHLILTSYCKIVAKTKLNRMSFPRSRKNVKTSEYISMPAGILTLIIFIQNLGFILNTKY